MAYFIRVFCTQGDPPHVPPDLDAVTLSARSQPDRGRAASEDTGQIHLELRHKDRRVPVEIEVNRLGAGDGESIAEAEVAEFLELMSESPDDAVRHRVERHLREARFVVSARLPTGDLDDDGWQALDAVLNYLVEHHGGMVQADGEGFYAYSSLIVALE